MSVYLVSICEITSFSEALSEYADVSAKLIEENGGHYVVRGPVNKVVEGALLDGKSGRQFIGWKNSNHRKIPKQRMYR